MAEAVVECSSENEPTEQYEEMLDFERQIFMDVIEKDCLVISAKYINLKLLISSALLYPDVIVFRGLHLDAVVTNLLKAYCDPGNLIIVLNSAESEEEYYIKKLNSHHVYSSTYQTAQNSR